MIDFHTHTFFSDGELVPSELVRRAQVIGYTAIGITDHVDASNIDFVLPRIIKVAGRLNACWDIRVIPGVEITHAPLEEIPKLVKFARKTGAEVVIGHGETPSEPVLRGTNRVFIENKVDILAHPGFIRKEDVELAPGRGVYLEITTRALHSQGNKHVAALAKSIGAKLILNTDSHAGADLITEAEARRLLKSLKFTAKESAAVLRNSEALLKAI